MKKPNQSIVDALQSEVDSLKNDLKGHDAYVDEHWSETDGNANLSVLDEAESKFNWNRRRGQELRELEGRLEFEKQLVGNYVTVNYHKKIDGVEMETEKEEFEFMQEIEVNDEADFTGRVGCVRRKFFVTEANGYFLASNDDFTKMKSDDSAVVHAWKYAKSIKPKEEYREFNTAEMASLFLGTVRDINDKVRYFVSAYDPDEEELNVGGSWENASQLFENFEYLEDGKWKPCKVKVD